MDLDKIKRPENVLVIFDKLFKLSGYSNDKEFKTLYLKQPYQAFSRSLRIVIERNTYKWFRNLELSCAEDLYVADQFQTYLEQKLNK